MNAHSRPFVRIPRLVRDLVGAALLVALMGAHERWRENTPSESGSLPVRSGPGNPGVPQLSTVELLKLYEAEGAGGTDAACELREASR